jgi:hypothetical protein
MTSRGEPPGEGDGVPKIDQVADAKAMLQAALCG